MLESIKLAVKGFIIGIANIIPGVSGGTLAITLGIYKDLIGAISHFFKDFKKNMKLLIPIGIGAVLSILLLSKLIKFCLDKYPFPTVLFFIGLILGGVPLLFKKVKLEVKRPLNLGVFLCTFVIVIAFTFMKGQGAEVSFDTLGMGSYVMLFIVGMIAAATMVIPGISGSFVLMLLGYYQPIIDTISDLTNFSNLVHNILILAPFGIGVVIGVVLIAKLIEFLLKRYETKTYFGILGFVLASIITIGFPLTSISFTVLQVVLGVLLLGIGFMIAYKLGDE